MGKIIVAQDFEKLPKIQKIAQSEFMSSDDQNLLLQIGYSVVRALADYRLASRYQLNLPQDRDLKVSIATESGPATTWHVTSSQNSKTGFREEVDLNEEQMSKKIYFLATGNGCSTLQVMMVWR